MENLRSDYPTPVDSLLLPDLLAMREHVRFARTEMSWIDTRVMIADPLTKEFDYHEALWEVAQKNRVIMVYQGPNMKQPKHLKGWDRQWDLQMHLPE
jgi:hypothetical protein